MKSKIMRLSKAGVIWVCFMLLAGYFGVCYLGRTVCETFLHIEFTFDYTNVVLQEGVCSVVSVLLLCLVGYKAVLKEMGEGFAESIYIGGFFFCLLAFSLMEYLYISVWNPLLDICPVGEMVIFFAGVLLTGIAEEIIFRGVILNLLLDRFGSTSRGIWAAVLIESMMFGLVHLTNAFGGVNPEAAFWQAVNAAFMGILFSAVYVRSNNIWMPIILHTLNNFAAGFSSIIWSQGTYLDDLNEIGFSGAAYLVMLIPAIILLRKRKMEEVILRRENAEIPVEASSSASAIVAALLGSISILLCWTGMFWSVGIMGILSVKSAKKKQDSRRKFSKIGMILSVIGTILGIVCMVGIIVYAMSLEPYYRYRLFMKIRGEG